MGLEIERKFIVKSNEWKKFSTEPQQLQQGYLSTDFEEWVIRLRIINYQTAKITLKARKDEISNHEFEYSIPFEDGMNIWNLITRKIIKKRYELNFCSQKWIVDVFGGKNHPLVLAEVELDSKNELVKKPTWCTSEVTSIKKFSNAALAQFPIANWSSKERESLNLH